MVNHWGTYSTDNRTSARFCRRYKDEIYAQTNLAIKKRNIISNMLN